VAKPAELPAVSVVVRSYHRREHLLTLVQALLRQDHPQFELLVLEQSEWSTEERAPLDALAAADPRLRVLYSRPLGVGGARDAGWRAARFGIILTIDDDDQPLDERLVSGHAANYVDPSVVAVTGRHVYSPDERCGYRPRFRARRYCLRYNLIGLPHAFCRFDERLENVHWVHGSNGSVRRDLIERVGGWDPTATNHDEHYFCLALPRHLRPGERLVFDPRMVLLRNKDVAGGAAVRWAGPRAIFESWHHYFHALVLRQRPLRSVVLYPLLPLTAWFMAARWIWTDAKMYASASARLRDTARVALAAPLWYVQELLRPRTRAPSLPIHQRPDRCAGAHAAAGGAEPGSSGGDDRA
jgi:glycosyltransferase involved in cell wall biosynthesis